MRTERGQIVFRRRVVHQKALLLVRSELGVALKDDHVQHRVAHTLIGNLEHFPPAPLALEIAEINFAVGQVAVLGLELVSRHVPVDELLVQADVVLPVLEEVDPVVEGGYARHGILLVTASASDGILCDENFVIVRILSYHPARPLSRKRPGGLALARRVTRPNSFIYTLFGDFVQRDPTAHVSSGSAA